MPSPGGVPALRFSGCRMACGQRWAYRDDRQGTEALPSAAARDDGALHGGARSLFLFRNNYQEWGLFSLSFHGLRPLPRCGKKAALPALTRIRAIFALCFASPFATFFHPRTGDKLCLEACQAWQTRKPGTKKK